MKRGELLDKNICEKKIQISPMRQQKLSISPFPIINLLPAYTNNKSNRKAMNRNWSNQKANPALKTKAGNK